MWYLPWFWLLLQSACFGIKTSNSGFANRDSFSPTAWNLLQPACTSPFNVGNWNIYTFHHVPRIEGLRLTKRTRVMANFDICVDYNSVHENTHAKQDRNWRFAIQSFTWEEDKSLKCLSFRNHIFNHMTKGGTILSFRSFSSHVLWPKILKYVASFLKIPVFSVIFLDRSRPIYVRQALALGFYSCGELNQQFMHLNIIQDVPQDNWNDRVFKKWPRLSSSILSQIWHQPNLSLWEHYCYRCHTALLCHSQIRILQAFQYIFKNIGDFLN